MGGALELAERAWQGELGEMNVHPGRAYVGLEVFDDRLAFMSAFSNVAALGTDEGLVFVDTSSPFHAARLHEAIGSDIASLIAYRLSAEALAAITCPVTLLRGSRSAERFGRIVERLRRLIPHAEVEVLEGATHMMHIDKPRAFNSIVVDRMRRWGVT